MDAQDSQVLRTIDPSGQCPKPKESPAPGTPVATRGRPVRSLEGRSVSRKRRRLSRSSSSSSTASSLAKVSRLGGGGRRDTSDLDAGYENDADDDDDDDDEDEDEEEEEEEEELKGDEDATGCEEEDEGHIKSEQHVFPTDAPSLQNAPGVGVRASASGADGGCGEKNGEKSTPSETADLNAPRQQRQHQHQQHPANYQHYHQQQQQQQQLPHQQLRHGKRLAKYDYTRDQMFEVNRPEVFQPTVIFPSIARMQTVSDFPTPANDYLRFFRPALRIRAHTLTQANAHVARCRALFFSCSCWSLSSTHSFSLEKQQTGNFSLSATTSIGDISFSGIKKPLATP